MECKRCGGPMMLETVIKLRHSFIGFRETRSAGAYCGTCKIGVAVESCPSARRRNDVTAPLVRRVLDRMTGLLCRSRPMHDLQRRHHRAAFRHDGRVVMRQDQEASGLI
jgi:hypothetical protein